jgi:hypothetical protein
MAHAGTPTDLAKQPATSSTNGLWQALLAGIVILAIGAGMAFVISTAASSKITAPAVDHRLDGIEAQRGAATLSVAAVKPDRRFDELIVGQAGPFSDGSYSQVEANRGGAFTAPTTTVSGTAPDYGNGRIQGHRGAMTSQ